MYFIIKNEQLIRKNAWLPRNVTHETYKLNVLIQLNATKAQRHKLYVPSLCVLVTLQPKKTT